MRLPLANPALQALAEVPWCSDTARKGSWTYPKYFAVLVVAVLPGVVLPRHSELVFVHIAQAQILARLHLLYEPAGELRLGEAGVTHDTPV